MGLISSLIGNYANAKMQESRERAAQAQQQADLYLQVWRAPDSTPAARQAAITNLVGLTQKHGGPEGKKHAPVLGSIMGTLSGIAGVPRQQQPPQPTVPMPSQLVMTPQEQEQQKLGFQRQEEQQRLTLGRAQAQAVEQTKLAINKLAQQGDLEEARKSLESIKNRIPADSYQRALVELETRGLVKIPAAGGLTGTARDYSWAVGVEAHPENYSKEDQQVAAGIREKFKPSEGGLTGEDRAYRWAIGVRAHPENFSKEDQQVSAGIIKKFELAQQAQTVRIETGQRQLTPPDIKPGTPLYREAQQLASGDLTFDQLIKLHPYRDQQTRGAVFDLATQLNPNFSPAEFEAGYKFFATPRTRQQIAALNNAETRVPDLLRFSDEAIRSGVTAANPIVRGLGLKVGGKTYSNFNTARTAWADELSGGLGYGSTTDMTREMAKDMTDPNLGPENFRAAVEDVLVPFLRGKRSSLTGQMGPYGAREEKTAPPRTTVPPKEGGGGPLPRAGKKGDVAPEEVLRQAAQMFPRGVPGNKEKARKAIEDAGWKVPGLK